MAQGNAVSLIPVHTELRIEEAADLLNVSQAFLLEQIAADKILDRQVGNHRRIHFSDLMAYKDRSDLATSQALDEMVAISQAFGLYDLEELSQL